MSLVRAIEQLNNDPAASGWTPRPGLAQLQEFLAGMKGQGLLQERPYDLPLPDYSGAQLYRRQRETTTPSGRLSADRVQG